MNKLYQSNVQPGFALSREGEQKSKKLYITLLAGGMGKRMQSNLPKVLHEIKGEAMIVRLLKQVLLLNPDKILVVVGKFRTMIQEEIEKHINNDKIVYVNQEEPLGTGHAVKCTLPEFEKNDNANSVEREPLDITLSHTGQVMSKGEPFDITNIVLNGDVPLLQYSTIKEIYDFYLANQSKLLITSINLSNPTGNGRIIIDQNKNFQEIVEEKDCSPEQKLVTLVNCGIYICSSLVLLDYIPRIKSNNAQGEYYLTDLVKIYRDAGESSERSSNSKGTNHVDLFVLPSDKYIEIYNVNTKEQLEYLKNSSSV